MTADNRLVCRRCGFSNVAGDQFCGSCGAFLEWEGEPAGGTAAGTPPAGSGAPATAHDLRDPDVPLVRPTGGGWTPTEASANAPTVPVSTPVTPAGAGADAALLRCPACGIANAAGRTFCQSCGSKLADAGRVGAVTREQIAAAVNAPVRPATVQPSVVRPARQAERSPAVSIVKWIAIMAVLGLLVGGGIVAGSMYLRGSGPTSGATAGPSTAAGSGSPATSDGPTASGDAPASGGTSSAAPTPKPVELALLGATASSVVGNRDKFQPTMAIDGDPKTCWQEGAKNEKGQWIEVTFAPSRLTGLVIVNGYTASTALYRGNRRLKDVEIAIDGGAPVKVRLDDTADPQRVKLKGVAGATRLRITIITTYGSVKTSVAGTPFDDAALGEITVLGVPGS